MYKKNSSPWNLQYQSRFWTPDNLNAMCWLLYKLLGNSMHRLFIVNSIDYVVVNAVCLPATWVYLLNT